MLHFNPLILFNTAMLSVVVACDGAAQDAVSVGKATVDDTNIVALKAQTQRLLIEFDVLAEVIAEDNTQLALERLAALQASVEGLMTSAATSTVPQTTPSPGATTRQITVQPSRSIETSSDPPTEKQIDEMERALATTHLPGPPLNDVASESLSPEQLHQASADAIVLLESAETAIRNWQLEIALTPLREAQRIIQELDDSL